MYVTVYSINTTTIMILIKLLKVLIKSQKMRVNNFKHWGSTVVVSKMNSTHNQAVDIDLFSLEDKKKILKVINSTNIEDLLQYSITKKRAQILESYRIDNGPYKSLEDLLQIKDISDKCLYKFYKSIICNKKKTGVKKVIRGLVLTPKTTCDEHKDVNTVLGIYIGQNMITWSLLNRDCEVLQWSHKSFSKIRAKNNIHSLLQMTLPIAATLPKADRYIMQEPCNLARYLSRKAYQVYVEQSIISTIILSYLTTLNCKIDDNTEFVRNNIFLLRQHILQKMYGLIIDNESISTQYIVQKLLQESELVGVKEHLPSVLIRTDLRNMYNIQSPIYQEQISWSLLIALAFMELVVHQRTDMIVRNAK